MIGHVGLQMRPRDYIPMAAGLARVGAYYGANALAGAGRAIYNAVPQAYNYVNNQFSRYVGRPARNIIYTGYLYDRLFGQPPTRRVGSHFSRGGKLMYKKKRKIKRRNYFRKK